MRARVGSGIALVATSLLAIALVRVHDFYWLGSALFLFLVVAGVGLTTGFVGRLAMVSSAVLLALPIGVAVEMGLNTLRLRQFAAQVLAYSLPPNTVLEASASRVGVFLGNGNHCDFEAVVVVNSPSAEEAVARHYAQLRLRPAIPGGVQGGLPGIEVRSAGRQIEVRATDGPYSAGLDWRCH